MHSQNYLKKYQFKKKIFFQNDHSAWFIDSLRVKIKLLHNLYKQNEPCVRGCVGSWGSGYVDFTCD